VFPSAITKDMNKALDEEVMEEEVIGALSSMKKGKI
jgi:hypothetical protein